MRPSRLCGGRAGGATTASRRAGAGVRAGAGPGRVTAGHVADSPATCCGGLEPAQRTELLAPGGSAPTSQAQVSHGRGATRGYLQRVVSHGCQDDRCGGSAGRSAAGPPMPHLGGRRQRHVAALGLVRSGDRHPRCSTTRTRRCRRCSPSGSRTAVRRIRARSRTICGPSRWSLVDRRDSADGPVAVESGASRARGRGRHVVPERAGRRLGAPGRAASPGAGGAARRRGAVARRRAQRRLLHAPGQLDLGRSTRLANRAQRRRSAVIASCAIPGCASATDTASCTTSVWWDHGGARPANLLPLCEPHHHAVHDRGRQLQLARNRELRVTLPDGQVMATGPPTRAAA